MSVNLGPISRLDILLYRLWEDYKMECHYAQLFIELFHNTINDHIAFRTIQQGDRCDDMYGIWPILHIFRQLGYKSIDQYEFPDKHLYAVHMEKEGYPKIFISQFEMEQLIDDPNISILQNFLENDFPIPPKIDINTISIDQLYNYFRLNNHRLLTRSQLTDINEMSQYAAWVCLFGNRVNHFTAKVQDIEKVVAKCNKAGIPMKPDIEGAPDSLLRQTSTKADVAKVQIILDKNPDKDIDYIEWPYAYYEIAERGKVEFGGFKVEQATKLFEMTKKE